MKDHSAVIIDGAIPRNEIERARTIHDFIVENYEGVATACKVALRAAEHAWRQLNRPLAPDLNDDISDEALSLMATITEAEEKLLEILSDKLPVEFVVHLEAGDVVICRASEIR